MKKTILFILFLAFVSGFMYFYGVNNKTVEVKVYFYNPSLDEGPGGPNCTEKGVVSVYRSISEKDKIIETLNILLNETVGEKEKESGFISEFPLEGVKLKSFSLNNNVAVVEIDDPKNKTSGGSCRVSIMRSQIEKTLLQFEGINEVKILPEYIFQP